MRLLALSSKLSPDAEDRWLRPSMRIVCASDAASAPRIWVRGAGNLKEDHYERLPGHRLHLPCPPRWHLHRRRVGEAGWRSRPVYRPSRWLAGPCIPTQLSSSRLLVQVCEHVLGAALAL